MADIHNYDFSGKRALIRVDFNVPLDKETMAITDDSKLCSADVVNKMEASQDYETEIQEATINQERAGGWKKSAMGRDS